MKENIKNAMVSGSGATLSALGFIKSSEYFGNLIRDYKANRTELKEVRYLLQCAEEAHDYRAIIIRICPGIMNNPDIAKRFHQKPVELFEVVTYLDESNPVDYIDQLECVQVDLLVKLIFAFAGCIGTATSCAACSQNFISATKDISSEIKASKQAKATVVAKPEWC